MEDILSLENICHTISADIGFLEEAEMLYGIYDGGRACYYDVKGIQPFGPPLLGPFSGIVATVHSAVSHLTLHYVSEVNKMLLDTALDRSFMIIATNCVDKYLKATGNVVLRVTPVRNITPLFYMIVLTDILSHALHRSHYVQQHYCTA